jgi:kumamolisin
LTVQRFTLVRHMSRRLTLCRRVGSCPADTPVRITVLLHARDGRALRDAVRAVSDPTDAAYGRHLSPDAVRDLVAPGTQDLDAVLAFLREAGLRVEGVSGARTAVQAIGPAEAVARAFDAPLGLFVPPPAIAAGRRRAYGVERDPTIPASLAAVIRGVAGLNDLPAARRFPPLIAPKRSRVPRRGPAAARGPGGGFTPEEIDAAYGVPGDPASGARGERVAILEFGGGFSSADFSAFCTAYGLPATDVTEVSVSGAKNDYRGPTGDADVEVALDMDWARATAPEAELDVWWVPNVDTGWVDFLTALVDAPQARRPNVVSISWGMPEDGFSTSRRYDQTRQLFQACALLGITIVCASGDAGAADELPGDPWYDAQRHVDFPSVVPEVTSVGGTKLVPAGRAFAETAWNDGPGRGASGGGFSRLIAVPGWQKRALAGRKGVTGRGVPDVAAVASPDPGLSIFVRGKWTAAGGTSVAAPIWAGFLARANAARLAAGQSRLGAANAALYGVGRGAAAPFRDIVRGDNGYAGVSGFSAAKGWDPVTGLGAPDVARLVSSLLR